MQSYAQTVPPCRTEPPPERSVALGKLCALIGKATPGVKQSTAYGMLTHMADEEMRYAMASFRGLEDSDLDAIEPLLEVGAKRGRAL